MRTRHFSSSNPVPSPLDKARGRPTHQPVLLHEVVRALDIQPDDILVDATLGGAGHAKELSKGLGGNGLFIGLDADRDAIARAEMRLSGAHARVSLLHGNFRNMVNELAKLGVVSITKTLFDLGWSSYQLDSGRGFSFKADEPLLMTYGSGDEGELTAATIVNTWGEESLADIFYGFGGERYSRRIAKALVERRKKKPFETSRDLAETIAAATPARYRHGRIHPATRTFQALRIAVNDELAALTEGLQAAWQLLKPRGRIAVISFHSVEDRLVKRMFAQWEKNSEGKLLSKKPIIPSRQEEQENPRARSAKLRVIEKISISHESPHTKNKQIRPLDFSGEA
ncbi:16S rRNA (cytosine(1402)-N(4))-methyltransferase RsmH [Candidatus Kaiserbacteria bacterium]|nr:16S rRNA (cytosine(1402)-N(4))-methyltransferase RsmH [Candidatus Kaiserbacteria bacterium]